MTYAGVIDRVAAHLVGLETGHPMRIAIDGRTACGKSTFARALAARLEAQGRNVLYTTIDGFHNPKTIRYARGRMSAEGYYRDARDLAAIRRELLDPLGPGGGRMIRTETFDLAADAAVTLERVCVPLATMVLVDGTFLARPELSSAWDVHIFLVTSREVTRERGVCRDAAASGGRDLAEAIYDQRYLPAFDLYLAEADPEAHAGILIDLDDFAAPVLRRLV